MNKNEMRTMKKSELRRKQDELLEKKKVGEGLGLPKLELQSRIVGINSNAIIGFVLLGSLLFNWRLYKSVNLLSDQVSDLKESKVSVEVNNQSAADFRSQERYLNGKLSEMKNDIINSIRMKQDHTDFNINPGQVRRPTSRSLVPSAIELINQVDIQQYTVENSQQYASFRSLLKRLSRMRYQYRKEIQKIVKAYSNTHHISGVDKKEYEILLDRRREAFTQIHELHENVKNDWKLNNKVSARF